MSRRSTKQRRSARRRREAWPPFVTLEGLYKGDLGNWEFQRALPSGWGRRPIVGMDLARPGGDMSAVVLVDPGPPMQVYGHGVFERVLPELRLLHATPPFIVPPATTTPKEQP